MPPAGFEPGFPTSERQQTHALDLTASGIDTQEGKMMRRIISLNDINDWFM
jgi:hypothetical protein